MTRADAYLCPCGATAPADLPEPGCAPVRCVRCNTPLVQPGAVRPMAVEIGFAAALVVAVAAAFGWMLVARATAGGAVWAIPVAAGLVGWAARAAARRRSEGVRFAAVGALLTFLALGEVLNFRHTTRDRLVAMHAAEGAHEPELLADEEMRTTNFLGFLRLEVDLTWCAAVFAGLCLAARITRPHRSVVAFAAKPAAAGPAPTEPAPAEPPAASPPATEPPAPDPGSAAAPPSDACPAPATGP